MNKFFRSVLIPKSVRLSVCVVLDCIKHWHRKVLVCGIHILPPWKRAQSPSIRVCVCVFPAVSLKCASVAPRQTDHPSRSGRGCVCVFERAGLT